LAFNYKARRMAEKQERFGTSKLQSFGEEGLSQDAKDWINHTRDPDIIAYYELQARIEAAKLYRSVHDLTKTSSLQDVVTQLFVTDKTVGFTPDQSTDKGESSPRPKIAAVAECSDESTRYFIVDSGASYNLINRSDITEEESYSLRKVTPGIEFWTANGIVTADFVVEIWVNDLQSHFTAYVLDDTPNALSMTILCDDYGFDYIQKSGELAYVQKGKLKVTCARFGGTPIIATGTAVGKTKTPDITDTEKDQVLDESVEEATEGELVLSESGPPLGETDASSPPFGETGSSSPPVGATSNLDKIKEHRDKKSKQSQSSTAKDENKHLPPPSHFFTHFPKHPHCEVCNHTRMQKSQHRATRYKAEG